MREREKQLPSFSPGSISINDLTKSVFRLRPIYKSFLNRTSRSAHSLSLFHSSVLYISIDIFLLLLSVSLSLLKACTWYRFLSGLPSFICCNLWLAKVKAELCVGLARRRWSGLPPTTVFPLPWRSTHIRIHIQPFRSLFI